MNRKRSITKPERCLNCNHPIDPEMEFCPNCGQKALSEHLTITYFVHEFLTNYFSFDSKFFNTIKPLITRPAYLTKEFIDGRRIRYINPIQLFVFISFLYFLVDSFMVLKEESIEKDYVVMKHDGEKIGADSLNIDLLENEPSIISDGLQENENVNPGLKDFIKKSNDFNQLEKDEQNEKISKIISYFIFLLMPLFALFLNFLFVRRNIHYLENLIFSLHFHAFFFLIGIFFMLIDRLVPDPYDSYLFGASIFVYLLVALKLFYAFTWVATSIRFVGLFFLYGFMVFLSYLLSIVISILL